MTPVEKMRQKQATSTARTAPAAAAPTTGAKPTLHYSCGHERPVADVAGKPCPACRQATAARRHAKKEAKPASLDAAHGRLPNGAVYHKAYDAVTETWTGTLTIPGVPALKARASGSFTVERLLDRMYREHLRESDRKTLPDGAGG